MDALAQASDFVRMIENHQGVKIAALEEISYTNGWISREQLLSAADRYGKAAYGKHLRAVADGKIRY